MKKDIDRSKKMGFRDYLTKPLNIDNFLKVIEHCLGG
jgi:DNA-binding response OmpR family regulator